MLDEKQLQELEELAKLPNFTIKKMALVLGVKEHELKLEIENGGAVADAYHKGRLTSEVEFNKKVQLLSNQGSGPAQTLVDKLRRDAEYQELRDHYK